MKKQETGLKVSEICREYGISNATFYNWKAKYGGMSINELKRMYAELSLVHYAFKDAVEKSYKAWAAKRVG